MTGVLFNNYSPPGVNLIKLFWHNLHPSQNLRQHAHIGVNDADKSFMKLGTGVVNTTHYFL